MDDLPDSLWLRPAVTQIEAVPAAGQCERTKEAEPEVPGCGHRAFCYYSGLKLRAVFTAVCPRAFRWHTGTQRCI